MSEALKIVKPHTKQQRMTQTVLDTIAVTPERVKTWLPPPFQRPKKVNSKVMELAHRIKEEKVIPGILTIGRFENKTYLLDGQHRVEAFTLAEIPEAYADVRIGHFSSMADMGDEFVTLNSSLVRLRPDDILRGLEAGNETLKLIRAKAPYVGYDMIRRGGNAPIVSMSALLRTWFASAHEVPASTGGGSAQILGEMSEEGTAALIDFLSIAFAAWGRDQEYVRLWGNLNLALCMWLYRRMVISQYSSKTPKLSKEQFRKCLAALSADPSYLEWLFGRALRETDRSPAYSRIKSIISKRLEAELGKKPLLPQPAWAVGR